MHSGEPHDGRQPRLAVFPKAYMDPLCISGAMGLEEWIRLAATLGVSGLEFYAGFLDLAKESDWSRYRKTAAQEGLEIPMLCCSPDFVWPDRAKRRRAVDCQKHWMQMARGVGARYCRVLSGQARPEVMREDGLAMVTDAIEECLEFAETLDLVLILENHYKDNYWEHPEFAQSLEVFCELLLRISSPRLAVNYDPSNALLAGDDPMTWLDAVIDRVATMHASDRYVSDERTPDAAVRLCHGEIGCGLVDYPRVLNKLNDKGFDGWISIEDGIEGIGQLRRSVAFLKNLISKVWTQNG
ncbi:MAG: sugar phosphate isomerase/epimerase [Bacteroidota bacterium]|nr:sugar phosphate isomerase/epimerase [Bacteroidota bacterium]